MKKKSLLDLNFKTPEPLLKHSLTLSDSHPSSNPQKYPSFRDPSLSFYDQNTEKTQSSKKLNFSQNFNYNEKNFTTPFENTEKSFRNLNNNSENLQINSMNFINKYSSEDAILFTEEFENSPKFITDRDFLLKKAIFFHVYPFTPLDLQSILRL